jgi:hypothetical protein
MERTDKMRERTGSDVETVREFSEALGENRERVSRHLPNIRRDLFAIMRGVANAQKAIAETLTLMGTPADSLHALAVPEHCAGTPALTAIDYSLVKASADTREAVLPDGSGIEFCPSSPSRSKAPLASIGPDVTLWLQRISTLPIHEGDNGRLYRHVLDAALSLMSSDTGSMQVFHPERGELRLLAERGFHPESAAYWQCIPLDSGSTCAMQPKHALSG